MKAIVIGAGVLGASTAYQLAKRGVDVTILERGVPGDAASAASFAWLNSNNKELRPYHDLNVMSIAEWSAVARELGDARWLHQDGNVHVAATAEDAEKLDAKAERLHSYGYAAIPMAPAELTRLDSAIRVRDEYELAVFFPLEGHISVPLLIHDLLGAAKRLGATVAGGTEVVDLITDGSKVRGVVLGNGDRLESDVVVLAAGAGIGALMASQGVDVRTEGSPGVTVTTSPGTSNLTTMLHLPGLSIRPDHGGRLVIRNARADQQIDPDGWTLPDAAVAELIDQTAAGLTDVDPTAVRGERVQIAARPYPFDGLPVVGHWDGLPGLYVMTMHSGVTMGAIMSRLAAEELTTDTPTPLLDGFRPARVIAAAEQDVAYFDPYAIEGEKDVSRT
ncbi:NAD(P)/FAD-dependent oxidoreductase [Agromyces aerolatus]|uniref:NAD(P)/FAD-dependent oxidoreductase n=1 Tax=Agromyces sp. LY-1074 TaxID=3074080 RepID=UPI002855EF6A|nr:MULTISPECIES: FAD-binding oxidoreductase [unclassified Agromyces]MDR5701858.1 FAD-binding oxidoreductase [Agromyces sp. LY-1074]MDR5708069.1 FAD-binding oxidoreductase [Agromyces sp. LY-1358]